MAQTIIYCSLSNTDAMGALYKRETTDFFPGDTDITKPLEVSLDNDGKIVSGTVTLTHQGMANWGSRGLTPMGVFFLDGVMYKYAISMA